MWWEARRNACSRTSSSMPGCRGSTTSSPVASREKAMRPGPVATLMMNGMPARARLMPALEREHRHGHRGVLPEQHVVLEEDGVAGRQVHLGHRHDLPFHLAGAGAELDLGHVLDAGRLAPARGADQVLDVEGRAARAAGHGIHLVLAPAPLALEAGTPGPGGRRRRARLGPGGSLEFGQGFGVGPAAHPLTPDVDVPAGEGPDPGHDFRGGEPGLPRHSINRDLPDCIAHAFTSCGFASQAPRKLNPSARRRRARHSSRSRGRPQAEPGPRAPGSKPPLRRFAA